jgi:hypothetical protein
MTRHLHHTAVKLPQQLHCQHDSAAPSPAWLGNNFKLQTHNQAVAWCRCWVMLMTVLSSPWRGICQGDLTGMWCGCWVILKMALLSHADDGATKSCWWWCYRVCLATMLLSPAGDSATESCWWRRCWGDVGRGAMSLSSHADDVATEATGPWHDVSVESCCAIGVRIYDRSHDVWPQSGCTHIISMYYG